MFDEESDEQDQEKIAKLAEQLSADLQSAVFAVLNHDSDILWYQLYQNGKLSDEYDSTPGYWSSAEVLAPTGGNAKQICATFNYADAAQIDHVLREEYVFAEDRHADLIRLLNLPSCALGYGFGAIANGHLPEGLSADDLATSA